MPRCCPVFEQPNEEGTDGGAGCRTGRKVGVDVLLTACG